MPVFTFEKISPSAPPEPVPVMPEPRQRGVIAQFFGRFAEARVQRKIQRKTGGVIARNDDMFEKPARD
jgi:hypothetical protein